MISIYLQLLLTEVLAEPLNFVKMQGKQQNHLNTSHGILPQQNFNNGNKNRNRKFHRSDESKLYYSESLTKIKIFPWFLILKRVGGQQWLPGENSTPLATKEKMPSLVVPFFYIIYCGPCWLEWRAMLNGAIAPKSIGFRRVELCSGLYWITVYPHIFFVSVFVLKRV